MNKPVRIIIGVLIFVVLIVVAVALRNDSVGNNKSQDVNNAAPADKSTGAESPDPVKSDTGNNNDTNQSQTGNGNNLTSPN